MDAPKKAEEVFSYLLEEILTEIVFQVEIEQHFEQSIQTQLKKYIKEEKLLSTNIDIFSGTTKDSQECVCPNCGRTVGAIRFAPHLEKCVGMGRSSSRIANRRILASSNSGKEVKSYAEDTVESNGASQSQNNIEWVPPKNIRRTDTRKKKDRSGKHYKNKRKIDDLPSGGADDNDDYKYNNMNLEEKQDILSRMCGVVSEHTGRLCTRSVRCPKHSDEQRNNVRLTFLPNNGIQSDFSKMSVQEGMKSLEDTEMIDIEQSNSNSPNKKTEKQYRLK